MFTDVMRSVAMEMAGEGNSDIPLFNNLISEAPIFGMLPVEPSTHGLTSLYETLDEVTGAGNVDLDDVLPEVSARGQLHQVDLKVIGGIMEVGEDKAQQYGGPIPYFNKNFPAILAKTGSDMETSLIYKTLRQYAINNGNYIKAGNTTANTGFSMLVVHYSAGQVTGLYDSNGFGNGKLFDKKPLGNGGVYKNAQGVLVYGIRIKTYFGIQLANENYVSSIVNIGKDSNKLTAALIDEALVNAHARPENTFIYCHPALVSQFRDLKGGFLQMSTVDKDVNRQVASWDGIPIVDSYNFLKGTEAIVS